MLITPDERDAIEEERKCVRLKILNIRAKTHGQRASIVRITHFPTGNAAGKLLKEFTAAPSDSPYWADPQGELFPMLLRPTTILVFQLNTLPSPLKTCSVSIMKELSDVSGENINESPAVGLPMWTSSKIEAGVNSIEQASGMLRLEMQFVVPDGRRGAYDLPSDEPPPDLRTFDCNETTGTTFFKAACAFVAIVRTIYVEPLPPLVRMTHVVLARLARYHWDMHQTSKFPHSYCEDLAIQLKEFLLMVLNSPHLHILHSQSPEEVSINLNWHEDPQHSTHISESSKKKLKRMARYGISGHPHLQDQLRIQIVREIFKCAIVLESGMFEHKNLTYEELDLRRDMSSEIPERQEQLFSLRFTFLVFSTDGWWAPNTALDRISIVKLLLEPIGEGKETGVPDDQRPYMAALASARGKEAEKIQGVIFEEINKLPPCSRKDHYRRVLTRLVQRADRLPERTLKLLGIVEKGQRLGSGAFATVYKGTWKEHPVAIKAIQLLQEKPDDYSIRAQFYLEVIMWATVKHEHILALHGIAEPQGLEQMCMISPYMDGKTVSERCPQPPSGMEQGDRRRLIQEIADGMAYLHSEGIVHGDLRGPNVFITRDGHAKIADFGLAVYVSGVSKNYLSMRTGNVRWIAPELIDGKLASDVQDVGGSTIYTQALGRPTMFSDVYSFACTCVEIIDGLVPYSDLISDAQVIQFVTTIQADGKYGRPSRPFNMPSGRDDNEALWEIIQHCWAPTNRPTFKEAVVRLSSTSTVHS